MSPWLQYAVLIALGFVPSLIWLNFYLRRDCHPEPKYLIIKTFLMGIIVSPIAIQFQLLFVQAISHFTHQSASANGTAFFLWAALVEELVKLLAVYWIALRSPEFDEPVDAMVYMITAAVGFAAMENILALFRSVHDGAYIYETLRMWTLRFVGATLLHTLASALLGYFLAMSWFYDQHRKKLIVVGLVIATLFHFTFNMILTINANSVADPRPLWYTTALLILMAFLVSVLFDKIRERHDKNSSLV
jgi:RsiW-degrading membrane proteinase PrsW (M82 family)